MTKKFKFLTVLALGAMCSTSATAQTETGSTFKLLPNDQFELGLNGGVVFQGSDLKSNASYGAGLHLRKALDHTFSIRIDANYGAYRGESPVSEGIRQDPYSQFSAPNNYLDKYETNIASGAVQVLFSLNNNRYETGVRYINPYIYVGGGVSNVDTKVKYRNNNNYYQQKLAGRDTSKIVPSGEVGGGVAFRVNDKFNIGIDQKVAFVFSKRGDLLDGYEFNRFRDILSYTSVRLNFNIGGKSGKTLPLWWTSPAENITARVEALEKRPVFDGTDTDGDGVIDAIDQEKDSPAGARVDTRGVALDSDGDGLADYKDKEPFSPIGYPIDPATGIAKVPKQENLTKGQVEEIVAQKLKEFEARIPKGTTTTVMGGGLADWFLPMINFDLGSAAVKTSEYGSLANIATVVMKNNVKIVVTGFTDKSGSDASNQSLSYRRAQAAIDHLTSKYGIARDRFVLNYAGENNNLVPTAAANMMNRRVEFKVATSETEQPAPAGSSMPKKSYKGNKSAGY